MPYARYAMILLFAFAFVGCGTLSTATAASGRTASTPARFSGGNGFSQKTAIVVHAPDQGSGVDAIHSYVKARYPRHEMTGRSVAPDKEKLYDIYELTAPDGKKRELWFDVTECWPRAKDI